jgi:hypothetical protein
MDELMPRFGGVSFCRDLRRKAGAAMRALAVRTVSCKARSEIKDTGA